MDSGRERGVRAVRSAGYKMGGMPRPARGGPGGARRAGPRGLNVAPPPAADPMAGGMGQPDPTQPMPTGGGFKSGGSVQGRAVSAGRKAFADDVAPPAPGKDKDGDSNTKTSGLKRGGRVK